MPFVSYPVSLLPHSYDRKTFLIIHFYYTYFNLRAICSFSSRQAGRKVDKNTINQFTTLLPFEFESIIILINSVLMSFSLSRSSSTWKVRIKSPETRADRWRRHFDLDRNKRGRKWLENHTENVFRPCYRVGHSNEFGHKQR